MTHPVFVFGVLPYLALSAVLPILGVMINRYPERTLFVDHRRDDGAARSS